MDGKRGKKRHREGKEKGGEGGERETERKRERERRIERLFQHLRYTWHVHMHKRTFEVLGRECAKFDRCVWFKPTSAPH